MHVLRETTSRGQCELVCPSRTGTREESGTLTQGGALFSLVPLVWEAHLVDVDRRAYLIHDEFDIQVCDKVGIGRLTVVLDDAIEGLWHILNPKPV